MKKRTSILLAAALVIAGVVIIPDAVLRSVQARIGPLRTFAGLRALWPGLGPLHTFELTEPPRYLTEELALAKARETLTRDGLDIAAWQPLRGRRKKSPGGRVDEFLSRNLISANRGVIVFTNANATTHLVYIKLNGYQVICQSAVGK